MNITDFADGALWAITPAAMDRILPGVAGMTSPENAAEARVQMAAEDEYEPTLRVVDGIAVIPVNGTITPRGSLFSYLFGGASVNRISADIDAADKDPRIRGKVLHVDSPGGRVSGVSGLAQFVRESAGKKPIVTFSDGQITSAATWIGSAADKKILSPTASDGSIGVLKLHVDWSKHDEKMGIKYTWLTAGKYKAVGNPDEPLTDEARRMLEGRLARVYDAFVADIAAFRSVSEDIVRRDMAEGRVFIGQESVDVGLADAVGTIDDAVEEAAVLANMRGRGGAAGGFFAAAGNNNQTGKRSRDDMKLSEIKTTDDLKAALPELTDQLETDAKAAGASSVDADALRAEGGKAESDRIMGLVKAHFGEEAHGRFAKVVDQGLSADAYQGLLDAIGAKAPGAAAAQQPAGGDPDAQFKQKMLNGIQGASAGDPGAGDGTGQGPQSWEDAVSAIMEEEKCTRSAAIKKAYAQYPALHKAFIKAANERKTG